jgi:hypothetical protein
MEVDASRPPLEPEWDRDSHRLLMIIEESGHHVQDAATQLKQLNNPNRIQSRGGRMAALASLSRCVTVPTAVTIKAMSIALEIEDKLCVRRPGQAGLPQDERVAAARLTAAAMRTRRRATSRTSRAGDDAMATVRWQHRTIAAGRSSMLLALFVVTARRRSLSRPRPALIVHGDGSGDGGGGRRRDITARASGLVGFKPAYGAWCRIRREIDVDAGVAVMASDAD